MPRRSARNEHRVDDIIQVEEEQTERSNPICRIVDKEMGLLECSRCGPANRWISRKFKKTGMLPKACPNCITRFLHNYQNQPKPTGTPFPMGPR